MPIEPDVYEEESQKVDDEAEAKKILEHTAETSRRVEVVPEAGEQLRVVKDDAEPDAGT